MPRKNPFLTRSFRVYGYRLAGGGMVLKVVDPEQRLERICVPLESLAHLAPMIAEFVRVNPHLRDPEADFDHFFEWLKEEMPEQDAVDIGDFEPDDYRNAFTISERADLAALQTRGPGGIEQTILMNLESLQFLGGEIEILLGNLRF